MEENYRELRIAFPPRLPETPKGRRFAHEAAQRAGLDAARSFDVQVAVSEACANAIEHGRPGEDIVLTARTYADRLEIDIFSQSDFHARSAETAEIQRYRGMGLPLMVALSDHLALYTRAAGLSSR